MNGKRDIINRLSCDRRDMIDVNTCKVTDYQKINSFFECCKTQQNLIIQRFDMSKLTWNLSMNLTFTNNIFINILKKFKN